MHHLRILRFSPAPLSLAVALAFTIPGLVQAQTVTKQSTHSSSNSAQTLPAVEVRGAGVAKPDDMPPVYAGGQVARGARLGMLGNTDMMDTPFSVTAYTAELIKNQQATRLADVFANDPGINSDDVWYFDNFNIRGFSSSRSSIGFNGLYGIASVEGVQLDGIERVEVFKGSSTLLNGAAPSGGVGGTINLAPKRAQDTPLTRLSADFIGSSNLGASLDLGRRFGRNDAFGIRLNAAHHGGNGSVDHEKTRASNLTLGVDYRSERLRASIDMGGSNQKISGARNGYSTVQLPFAPDGRKNPYPEWSYQDKNHTFGMVRAEYDLTSFWSIGGAFGMSEAERKQNTPWGELLNEAGDLEFENSGFNTKNKYRSSELNTRLKFGTGPVVHTVVLALTDYNAKTSFAPTDSEDWSGQKSNINDPISLIEITPTSYGTRLPYSDSALRSYAITDTLSMMNERILMTLGLRHQNITTNSYDDGDWESGYKRGKNTPAAGLVVKPIDNLSLYANYIEALEEGPVAPMDPRVKNAGEVFPPSVSKQWELGAKIDLGAFGTTLSAYQIKRPSGFVDTTDGYYRLAGEQRNRGVELSIFGEAARGLRLLGGVAYSRAILAQTANGQYDGNHATGVPTWVVKLSAEYDIQQVPGLTATTHMVYNSSVPFNLDNTEVFPAWTRFDVGARYASKIASHPVVFRATVKNIFDRRYWGTGGYGFAVPAAPRTYMLSASVDF